MTQKIIDKGLDNYISQLKKLAGKDVVVGVLAEDADEKQEGEEITLYEKARKTEFGIGVPKRPFMRVSYEKDEERMKELFKKMDKSLFSGNIGANGFLDRVGQEHVNTIQLTMKNGRKHFQLNSKEWAAEKGKPQVQNATPEQVTPTINTGQLRQSINFEVKDHE